jgi:hypothetical protein
MPWSKTKTIPALENKSEKIKEVFAEAANSALNRGLSEQDAIFAGLAAVSNYEKKNQVKKVSKPEVPSHLKALLEVAKQRKLEQLNKPPSEASGASSKQQSINVAFLGKNAIQADPERSLVSVQWDKQGRLIFNFDDGEQLITDPVPVSENIEQYVTISAAAPSTEVELNLDEIENVQLTNPQQGQVLKYNALTQTWTNQQDNATGDDPETNAVLTYNTDGAIIRIDYDSGNYKLFSYDLEDNLSRLDYVKGSLIYRKDYVYTAGLLTQVNDSIVGV